MNISYIALLYGLLASIAGCSLYSHTNRSLPVDNPDPSVIRATYKVTADRGDDDTLVVLALSGGGSRSAYWSTEAMLKFQEVFDAEDFDLLSEVDVISSVSGGSLPAAYYAISTDTTAPALHGRTWDRKSVERLMSKNYVARWFGNWFWPSNIAKFWFTSYDRTDIMAQTFSDNLFDRNPIGAELKMRDLNPERPYLILNAANGTNGRFGTLFSFTQEDFAAINSDIGDYSLARAVMGTATFPAVFNYMTLRDFTWSNLQSKQYVHVFDGGNFDNLGLTSIRLIMEAQRHHEKLVVILIDAFADKSGVNKTHSDSRRFLDFVVDTNFLDATDALLFRNRDQLLRNFEREIATYNPGHAIFYHLKFEDIDDEDLRRDVNSISTNFTIEKVAQEYLKRAADRLLTTDNECLVAIKNLIKLGKTVANPLCKYSR